MQEARDTDRSRNIDRILAVLAIVGAALSALLVLSACQSSGPSASSSGSAATSTVSQNSHQGLVTLDASGNPMQGGMGGVNAPEITNVPRPAAPDLTTPLAAVKSYLAWTTYAYRVSNSDVATMAFSNFEEVRVNSYVQLNEQSSKLIDQKLVTFTPGKVSIEGTRAVMPAKEDWTYRYLSLSDQKPLSPVYTVSYDTTYTVVRDRPRHWLVDSVAAKAHGEVK